MNKKILSAICLMALMVPSVGAYEEVECSTNTAFSENSCNQCFTGGDKSEGDLIGLLSDLWVNATDVKKILYKEIQTDPEMINLDTTNVSWTQTPSSEGFWEYTDEFNALYDELEEGYVLEPGKETVWLKSKLSHAYKLDKNTASEGSNIGMLVFPISTHNILDDGEITYDTEEHRECVLYKSAEAGSEGIVEQPRKLPDTGPAEFMLFAILAMILGFGFMYFRTKS